MLLGQPSTNQNYNDSLEIRFQELENKINQIDKTINETKDDLLKINDKTNENLDIATSRFKEFSNTINFLSDSLLTKEELIVTLEETKEELIVTLEETKEELIVTLEEKEKEINEAIIHANSQINTLNNLIDDVQIDSDKKIKTLNKTITDRTLYWIIIILIILIMVIVTFFFLKSKVTEQKDSLSSVKQTQKKLENESIQLDTKLIQVLEQRIETASHRSQPSSEVDHSLPLTLGNEIHRMRKRLKTMDNSHSTKILINRIDKLEEKISDMGYVIVDLEGELFNEGMNVKVVNRIDSSELKTNEQVIARVIKPHIKFNDEIKQHAEVEVHHGI